MDFALKFKDRIFGLVVHDQTEITTRLDDYVAALQEIESRSKKVQGSPYLFVEYAVCAITPNDPELPEVIQDIQKAVDSGLDAVLNVIQALSRLEKPLHFHLHDGHPLSTFSPFGVSDHLSFLVEIPIPFEYKDRRSLDPMFGPSGLSRIVTKSLKLLGPDRVSFTLEIHPTEGRLPLANADYMFNHWRNKTNAERMNYWLSILAQNHKLLIEACKKVPSQ
jgi:hypothetical protein